MLLAFLIVSFIIGLFVTYLWSADSFGNVIMKMAFTCYTVWAGFLLLGYFWQNIEHGALRLM